MSSQRKVRGEGRASTIPNIVVSNVRGCSTHEVKKGEIGEMFLRRRLDVYALSEIKLKEKYEVMFGEVVVRVSSVAGGRAREGVTLFRVSGC